MLAACPFPASHGTPGSIREMAEAVAGLGHEVHLVTYHFGENIPVKGPRIHRITPCTHEATVVVGPTIRKPLYNVQMIFKTLEVVRTYRPDLLHAHGYEAALIAWVCRVLTGLPVLYSGHNTMADELASYRFIRPRWLANTLARVLDAWVPRLADRCLPHSSNLARFFRERGLEGRTEAVINFGINLDGLDEGDGAAVRRRYALGSGPVVVYTGVLDSFQRLDLLLEAMAGIVRVEPAAKLLIVATVPQPEHLAQVRGRAEELGIGAHVITTDVPLAAVRDFLAAADVAVVPRPRAPGFPIKLLNYFAARKPCVLFASSASRGLVHRENAFLVEPDTGAALGQAIVEVLRDAALSRHLADNGYQFVHAHHDRQMIARQVCDAYARTLAQNSRSGAERGMQKATYSCSAYS
jgi:glycosyltransferase involved in cell wall biosynthesis